MIRGLNLAGLVAVLLAGRASAAGPGRTSGDGWLTNAALFPPLAEARAVRSNLFASLRAEAVAGRLKILWPAEPFSTNATVTLHASAGEPGHWPARDWRSLPMGLVGARWEAAVPVEDVDEPVIYFVRSVERGATNHSPLRVCVPRAAGLEEPTRIFWPFLEGFETGAESWRTLSEAPDAARPTEALAKSGRASLAVTLPPRQRSVTVGTTRLRGAQLQRAGATGVRLWLRTRAGAGTARFTLLAHAFTTNQVVAQCPREVPLDARWQRVDLPFSLFPNAPLGAVDFFTVEFIGEGPQEFLIDDVQWLGPWKLEPE